MIIRDLTDLIDQLFVMYPSLTNRSIVFAGESFAARTVVHTTKYWQQHRPQWHVQLLVLNSPSLDLRLQTPAFLQLIEAHRLVSRPTLTTLHNLYAEQTHALDQQDISTAIEKRVLMLDYFREASGNVNMWDIRMGGAPYRLRDIRHWCNAHLADLHVYPGTNFTEASRDNFVFTHLRVITPFGVFLSSLHYNLY